MSRADSSDGMPGPAVRPGKSPVVARPALIERIGSPARVTVVSGPPGSGKSVLLRSWAAQAPLAGRVGWAAMGPDQRDPQQFWLAVVAALRGTEAGAALVRGLTAAPSLDGWGTVERLLEDLARLPDPLWLVLDDLHELDATDALRQLELLVLRGPEALRFVLATRHDLRLGLHRLRLEGELAEVRASDLRFTRPEAEALLEQAGVGLSDSALRLLHERTEGWAAGLRMAALFLAGREDPEQSALEFSGSERTVAEYLLDEVLDGQPEHVRRLLLKTSILESVEGELADLLTGDQGAERVLLDLEQANALIVAQDAGRSRFRYHQLFADFLRSELRRTAPSEVAGLHRAAGQWYAAHQQPVQAIRHAQAAGDQASAARLLADHWTGLYLDGNSAVANELLAAFPPQARTTDAELACLSALDALTQGLTDSAEPHLRRAERLSGSVPTARSGQLEMLLGVARLLLARLRGNLRAVVDEARVLRALAGSEDSAVPDLGQDLHALCLTSLGIAEVWAGQFPQARLHLRQALAVARRSGRTYLEFTNLAFLPLVDAERDAHGPDAQDLGAAMMELANRHGWTGDSVAGIGYTRFGISCAWQARMAEAEDWVLRAERVILAETDPLAALGVRYVRGLVENVRRRHPVALAALRSAESLAADLNAPLYMLAPIRAQLVHALVRLGDLGRAEQAIADTEEHARECGELRVAAAEVALAREDPHAAIKVLGPVVDGTAEYANQVSPSAWHARALLLQADAHDRIGDGSAAEQALEQALDVTETSGAVAAFLLHPVADLLARHPGYRTSHGALIADITSLLAGATVAAPPTGPDPLAEPLSGSELRVLRYLPTNLAAPEIAEELSLSLNTVKTHMRKLYAKLDVHRRAEAVELARSLGLLAPTGQAGPSGQAGGPRR